MEIVSADYFKTFVHQISNPNNGTEGRQGCEFIFRLGRLEYVLGRGAGATEKAEVKVEERDSGEGSDLWAVGVSRGRGEGSAHRGDSQGHNFVLRQTEQFLNHRNCLELLVQAVNKKWKDCESAIGWFKNPLQTRHPLTTCTSYSRDLSQHSGLGMLLETPPLS